MLERNSNCWYKEVCTYPSCNSCLRYNEVKFLMDSADIPENLQRPIILYPRNNHDKEMFYLLKDIKDNIKQFVTNGSNLYICSNYTGNGKTSWSIKLLLKYFDLIWAENSRDVRGLFLHVPSLLSKLKNFDKNLDVIKEEICNVDLVIFDDIGFASKLSDYEYAQLLSIIDIRLNNKKANIYTSNIVNPEELAKKIGVRLASRVYNSSLIVELTSLDCRGGNIDSFTGNK